MFLVLVNEMNIEFNETWQRNTYKTMLLQSTQLKVLVKENSNYCCCVIYKMHIKSNSMVPYLQDAH